MEGGTWTDAGMGTPQGAIVSPILANVFLHYALDLWFHKKWRPNVPKGEAIIVRYADDSVPRRQGEGHNDGHVKMPAA